MPCAAQVESAGHAGFDFVVLDTEHGPGGGFALEEHLRAAAIPALVRVAGPSTPILAALDAGATGRRRPARARRRRGRGGRRGRALPAAGPARASPLSTRAGRYGAVSLDDHLRRAAEETCVIVQIEDREALEHADAILAVPGVTGVLIGAADLSLSLGRPAPGASSTRRSTASSPPRRARGRRGDDGRQHARPSARTPIVALRGHQPDPRRVRGRRRRRARRSRPEPLVLLPGMLGEAALWDAVAPSLAEHAALRFARIDLDDTVQDMAAGVLASAPERFALAGHSLGAIVALEVMRQAPERVTRLALLNASARPANDAQRETWAAMRDGEFGARGPSVRAWPTAGRSRRSRRWRTPWAREASGASSPRRRHGPTAARRCRRSACRRSCSPAPRTRSARRSCRRSSPPASRARGTSSIEGAGHMAPLDAPAAVAAQLQNWLKGHT